MLVNEGIRLIDDVNYLSKSIARQKRALDQEDEEFAQRLANTRKREEIIRRKEKGRVIKKAVRFIETFTSPPNWCLISASI